MKYIGKIKEEETLYVLQDGGDIYVCDDSQLYFPDSLGYDQDVDQNTCIENMKIGDKIEVEGWLLVLKKKSIKALAKLTSMASPV